MIFNGKHIRVSVFGQSHAPAIGAVIDGLPAGFRVDLQNLQAFMDRRAPGQGDHTTARKEPDIPEFLSGLADGVTCGAPVCAVIRNRDTRSSDYSQFRDVPRPSHADWPAMVKYGDAFDIRGGGSFSGRLTAPLCTAGGIALQMLEARGILIGAYIRRIGETETSAEPDPTKISAEDIRRLHRNDFPALQPEDKEAFLAEIAKARADQDSVGGIVECLAVGLPAGIGGPLFEGLESALAAALFAIPAVRGVEFGDGFGAGRMRGSAHNDGYTVQEGRIRTLTNHAGGIAGGMTTGMPLILRTAFKPTPSIGKTQQSVNLRTMEPEELTIRGRHDPCIVPRAVPAVEAVTALVLLDQVIEARP